MRACVRSWPEEADLDLTILHSLDDRRVVVGDSQRHLGADLPGEVGDEIVVAVSDAAGVFRRNNGEYNLGILGFPVLRLSRGDVEGQGRKARNGDTTIEHDASHPV